MQFNHHSNQFEGNTLVYDETQLLLIHGRAVGDHTIREYEEMKAHNVAFNYMCELAEKERLIDEADIRDLNRICLKEPFYKKARTSDGQSTMRKITPGKYKIQPNHVVTQTGEVFHFASPEETPAKTEELVKWIQVWLKKDKAEQHKYLVSFSGETAPKGLFVFTLLTMETDEWCACFWLIYWFSLDFLPMVLNNREEYIKAIQFADTGNISHLENLFLNNIITMLERGIYSKNNKMDLNQSVGEWKRHKLSQSGLETSEERNSHFRGNDRDENKKDKHKKDIKKDERESTKRHRETHLKDNRQNQTNK